MDSIPPREQEELIAAEGSAFVSACPGAGKTYVMTERARHLFRDVPSGRGVAFLSFTHAAVFELEARLRAERLLPIPVFPSFVGTFDSFVWQFLVAPFKPNGSNAPPQLISDIDNLTVIPFEGARGLPLSCFCRTTGAILKEAARSKGFDLSPGRERLIRAYTTAARNLRTRLRERGKLGFDDARAVALERLKDRTLAERIGAALHARFIEVVVDEAQDCNPGDLAVIIWLRRSGLPVKVVCDPNQSIYAFRGGITDHLVAFAGTFLQCQHRSLTGNFRSTPNICKAIAQLRPRSVRGKPDDALGSLRDDTTPVRVLSYKGKVTRWIGVSFLSVLKDEGVSISSSPIVAATKTTGAAAAGQGAPTTSDDRLLRLAESVRGFHSASGFDQMEAAIEGAHRVALEVEGRLTEGSYHKYLVDNEIEASRWRSSIVAILRDLRYDPEKHCDARGWHKAAKDLLSRKFTVEEGQTISKKVKWNSELEETITIVPDDSVSARTIHSVKGKEYPAVCVVATSRTLKGILDFLETGEPHGLAEEARKIYVAASRAQRLLVIAAPMSQAERLTEHLSRHGASVILSDVLTPAAKCGQ